MRGVLSLFHGRAPWPERAKVACKFPFEVDEMGDLSVNSNVSTIFYFLPISHDTTEALF